MKSSIKVGYFPTEKSGLQPCIDVKLEESDDVRDTLLKSFFEKLGRVSGWLAVRVEKSDKPEVKNYKIIPITPGNLREAKKRMYLRAEVGDCIPSANEVIELPKIGESDVSTLL